MSRRRGFSRPFPRGQPFFFPPPPPGGGGGRGGGGGGGGSVGGEGGGGRVSSTQNIGWREIERWTGIACPVVAERHSVLALEGPDAYTFRMPVYKDLGSPGMFY